MPVRWITLLIRSASPAQVVALLLNCDMLSLSMIKEFIFGIDEINLLVLPSVCAKVWTIYENHTSAGQVLSFGSLMLACECGGISGMNLPAGCGNQQSSPKIG